MTRGSNNRSSKTKPWWVGYVVAAIAELAVAAGLLLLLPLFPLANYPMPYVLIIMMVAYIYGDGPAILSFILGLILYTYASPPYHGIWPIAFTANEQAGLVALFMGTGIVGFATHSMRKSKNRAEILAAEVQQANQHARDTLDSLAECYFVLDSEWRVADINRVAEDIAFLCPTHDLLGKSFVQEYPHVVDTELYRQCKKAIETQQPAHFEDWFESADRWFECHVFPQGTRVEVYLRDITDRKKAEQDLRRSEEKYRELVQHANSIILRWNREGKLTFFNEFAQSFFGYSQDEVIGKSVIGTIVPETDTIGRDLVALMEDVCNNPNGYEANINENMLKSGKRVWIAWTNRPVFDENRQLIEVLSVGVDITELRLATEAVRDSKQMLQLVFDTVPARVFWKNRDSVYMGCSRLFAADAGLASPADIVGKTDFDLPWKNTQAESYRADDRMVMETGSPKLGYEETQDTAQGRRTWLVTSKVPLRDADDNVIGVLGTYEDITQRKLAEERLRKSEERFRNLYQRAADGLFLHDLNGRFIEVNQTACQTLGYSREELLKMTVADVVVGYDQAGLDELWRQLMTSGPMTVYTHHRRKDGSTLPVEGRLSPFEYNDQMHVLAVVRDVTERQRAEEERHALEQHMEEQKRSFYRETIYSVTDGKLDICSEDEIMPYIDSSELTVEVHTSAQVAAARHAVEGYCRIQGLDEDRLNPFMIGVGEAITNAVKHGTRGSVYAGVNEESVWVGIKDNGPGIGSLILPRAVLQRGFSTKPSLGLGYCVMLDVADQLHLKTDEHGTVVILAKRLKEQDENASLLGLPDTWANIPG